MDFSLLPAGRDRLSLAANHRVDSLSAKDVRLVARWPGRRNADGAPGSYRAAAADTGERPMKLLLALLAAGGLTAGLLGNLFGNHPYAVTACFLSAEGLTPQNDVVINGARVGKVSSVAIAPDNGPSQGGAQVVLEVDGRAAPLHRGTRATVRPKGLLGNPFVELTPGSPGSEVIASGGTLPLQDTASPVDLDQVMDLFDPQTRARIQTLTREGGASLANRGSDLNTFLAALPPIIRRPRSPCSTPAWPTSSRRSPRCAARKRIATRLATCSGYIPTSSPAPSPSTRRGLPAVEASDEPVERRRRSGPAGAPIAGGGSGGQQIQSGSADGGRAADRGPAGGGHQPELRPSLQDRKSTR